MREYAHSRGALRLALLAPAVMAAGLSALPASAEQIEIVGSSTVYPFSTVVAERFGQVRGVAVPKVESTGTGGGMKLLCAGIGDGHPDISNASRAIKASEVELCASNGVSRPLEVKIGFDGIVMASSLSSDAMSLTREEVFLALARDLPDSSGELRPNPHVRWSDINPSLPNTEIRVYGPPPTSGTRDAFVELAMEEGCEAAPGMAALKAADGERFEAACASVREDGAFIEAGENDNLIIQRLVSNEDSFGIFGYSFLEENVDRVRGVSINGVEPTFESIEAGDYPLARPLYFYVKAEHAASKPGLSEFVRFFVSDAAVGPDGFLVDRGLIPLPAAELGAVRSAVERAL